MAERWFVYMVRCADHTLYTGVAKDIGRRIAQHNAGLGAKYTRGRLPVKLVYDEELAGHGDALRREIEIKQLDTAGKNALIGQQLVQP